MKKERGELKGVITVEMSYIVPLVLLLFLTIIYVVFYFHDKNIILGAAEETAVLGAQLERKPDENGQNNLSEFYQERVGGKLILLPKTKVRVEVVGDTVVVSADAKRGWMAVAICRQMPILKPEKKIRFKRLMEEQSGTEREVKRDESGDSKGNRSKIQ